MSLLSLMNSLQVRSWAILPGSFAALSAAVDKWRPAAGEGSRQGLQDSHDKAVAAVSQSGVEEGDPFRFAYSVDTDGIAEFAITGVLAKSADWWEKWLFGVQSTEEIAAAFEAAIADPAVRGIFLRIDSPGGEVDGTVELADAIYAARGAKPIMAFADGTMASAAYWIGSAADEVRACESSYTGSIGAMMAVLDCTEMNRMAGIGVELITSGPYKAVGSPDQPLSAQGRDYLQYLVDQIHTMFTERVMRNRGMSAEAVGAVADGRVFSARDAYASHLIDAITTRGQALDVVRAYASLWPAQNNMRNTA